LNDGFDFPSEEPVCDCGCTQKDLSGQIAMIAEIPSPLLKDVKVQVDCPRCGKKIELVIANPFPEHSEVME